MFLEKIYFGLLLKAKAGKEKKITSYIVLLSNEPISATNLAHQGWIGCASWLVAPKANKGSQISLEVPGVRGGLCNPSYWDDGI